MTDRSEVWTKYFNSLREPIQIHSKTAAVIISILTFIYATIYDFLVGWANKTSEISKNSLEFPSRNNWEQQQCTRNMAAFSAY